MPLSKEDPEYDYFIRWLQYNWRPRDEGTLAELFLSERRPKIDNDLRRLIEATVSAPYSFYQALKVEPGVGMALRDVLRKREFQITERSASSVVEKGNILFARLVEMDGIAFLMGNGTKIILSMYLEPLLDLRKLLEEEGRLDMEPEASEILVDFEDVLRDLYFKLVDASHQMPVLTNADGDPIELYSLRLCSPVKVAG